MGLISCYSSRFEVNQHVHILKFPPQVRCLCSEERCTYTHNSSPGTTLCRCKAKHKSCCQQQPACFFHGYKQAILQEKAGGRGIRSPSILSAPLQSQSMLDIWFTAGSFPPWPAPRHSKSQGGLPDCCSFSQQLEHKSQGVCQNPSCFHQV